MSRYVTDEMVETAARAIDHAYNPEGAPVLAAMFRDYARAALEAAAPQIAATAPADRPTVTDDARAEAARRWGDRRTSDRLPMDWLDEGMASGFVLGAQWAADRAEQIEKEDE